MDHVDIVVIGAGVVGLACARALALAGREVVLLESEPAFGTGVSSRNSEVIHAGLYYPNGSLKARHCVAGRQLLYQYCVERAIPFRRCGKLLVATDDAQIAQIGKLLKNAAGNGVDDLQLISAADAMALEPALNCLAALLSPSSGIIDSHTFMLSLLGDLENAGGTVVFNTPVIGGRIEDDGVVVMAKGADPLKARLVVNCAALGAQAVANALEGFPKEHIPVLRYARGVYFTISGRAPFSHLIYPLPEAAGLGVHLTLDLGGQAKFGPDVEWIDKPSFDVDATRAKAFYGEIRKYWPGIDHHELQPAYAGIRPKIHGPTEPAADFHIAGRESHGVPGVINLFGIESPGLTASLSIAEHVADMAANH
ncbi:MAG: NAD(P)/FAD-dependent oxidoreductase [Betaproteobacteria bacterium]|nr:NAD(P)/FAD-dependent oxidoreductase [Betaproteobacteria bacterium]